MGNGTLDMPEEWNNLFIIIMLIDLERKKSSLKISSFKACARVCVCVWVQRLRRPEARVMVVVSHLNMGLPQEQYTAAAPSLQPEGKKSHPLCSEVSKS